MKARKDGAAPSNDGDELRNGGDELRNCRTAELRMSEPMPSTTTLGPRLT